MDNENGAAVGMFHRWVYPLEMGLGASQNDAIAFAILVKPPDYVGKPNCGQGGDHEIAKNAAVMQYTAGWDWVRATPDRNTGLWDLVELEVLRLARLSPSQTRTCESKQHFTSHVPPISVKVAVSTRITLVNATYASSSDIFTVKATVQETLESSMSKPFPLVDTKDVNLPLIEMKSPKLWWPHTSRWTQSLHFTPRALQNQCLHATCRPGRSTEFVVDGGYETRRHKVWRQDIFHLYR